ncbi:MAG TPA: alginate lyase family protein [Bryobacteraceae bacterium]|nr:alginate lyase family protein [Bryobacteraceae bacterium]
MRSREEILFRLGQETGNLWLYLAKPRCAALSKSAALPLKGLPQPESVARRLRGTAHAVEVERLAEQILAHRFPLLGLTIETGPEIAWRRDPVSGIETGLDYLRRIPYLDAGRVGDHKVIWELNRHQHWVLLAQAWLLTGKREYLGEIRTQFESWCGQNPFQSGINWTSALEVAFRALSWIWVYHLAGDGMEPGFRERFLNELYRHGLHIERNLSIYFSPNTHLLGEAVALHALGALFPAFPKRWAERGGAIVRQEMERQVHEDGSHFEQSSYYHVYALDMFLFHAVVAGSDERYRHRLTRMAEYAADLMGPQRTLPFLGDDDGGRFFHPFGARDRFGRATLAACAAFLSRPEWLCDPCDLCELGAWWLGPEALDAACGAPAYASKLYPDAGIAVMTAGDVHILVDAGPFGVGSGGHSHSDTLSIVARCGGRDILIDPGTFTYVGDPTERDRFRGSAAHNTIRIDGRDQAEAAGPFRWNGRPEVRVLQWSTSASEDMLEAECHYDNFTHRRRVAFRKPGALDIADTVTGPAGEHTVEQFWHGDSEAIRTCASRELLSGWRSRALGHREPVPVLRVVRKGELPISLRSTVILAD